MYLNFWFILSVFSSSSSWNCELGIMEKPTFWGTIRRRRSREKTSQRIYVIIKCEARTCNNNKNGWIHFNYILSLFHALIMWLLCSCFTCLVLTIIAPSVLLPLRQCSSLSMLFAFPLTHRLSLALTFIFPISFAWHCKMTCESLLRSNYLFGPFEGDGCVVAAVVVVGSCKVSTDSVTTHLE